MTTYCETCHHNYFKSYYKKHLKTNLHKNRGYILPDNPQKDYICSECNRTHIIKDIVKYNSKTYTKFEGCSVCLHNLKIL